MWCNSLLTHFMSAAIHLLGVGVQIIYFEYIFRTRLDTTEYDIYNSQGSSY